MPIAKITTKGQITIPAQVRTELNLKPGDRVYFYKNEVGQYTLLPKNGSVEQLKGILGTIDRVISTEEMKEAVSVGLAAKMSLEEVETL